MVFVVFFDVVVVVVDVGFGVDICVVGVAAVAAAVVFFFRQVGCCGCWIWYLVLLELVPALL